MNVYKKKKTEIRERERLIVSTKYNYSKKKKDTIYMSFQRYVIRVYVYVCMYACGAYVCMCVCMCVGGCVGVLPAPILVKQHRKRNLDLAYTT